MFPLQVPNATKGMLTNIAAGVFVKPRFSFVRISISKRKTTLLVAVQSFVEIILSIDANLERGKDVIFIYFKLSSESDRTLNNILCGNKVMLR